jgi:thiosulfate/3-mercaptopyruvate sulfurtransferase
MHNGEYFITPESLEQILNDPKVALIDTRNPAAYNAGHISGAVNIHDFFTYLARESNGHYPDLRDHFAAVLGNAGVRPDQTIVLYEDNLNNGYGQSCRGWVILSTLGHRSVKVLYGGLTGWKARGLSTTTAVTRKPACQYPLNDATESLLIDKSSMLHAVRTGCAKLLDTRNEDEWIGDSSSPYGRDFAPRKGRLPSAVWLQWDKLMTADGQFRPAADIVAMLKQLGISREDQTYLYCFKGARASNTLLALKMAGFNNVRLYFGSWNEWSRDERLPIDAEAISQVAA